MEKFEKKCREFGLDWNQVINYDDNYKYVPTLNNSNVVIFDSNNVVIGIENLDSNIKDTIDSKIVLYETSIIGMPFPFTGFSIKNIVELNNLIDINNDKVFFNDRCVENPVIKGVLAYLKLLKSEIDDYYLRVYPLILQNLNVPQLIHYIPELAKSMDIKNIKDSVSTLRNTGLWYDKKDSYNSLIKFMKDAFRNDCNDNYINELCSILIEKEEKVKELIKK